MSTDGVFKYTVKVISHGPDDCQDAAEIEIEIPKKIIIPKIKELVVSYGDCKTEVEKRKRKVTFTSVVIGDDPEQWTFHFGDGTTTSGSGKPPVSIERYYEKKPASAPKLCLIGPSPHKETCMKADLSAFKECPPCPRIIDCIHSKKDKDEGTKVVEMIVDIKGTPPEKLEWNWGDGSPKEITTGLSASHNYNIPQSGVVKHDVKITAVGPNDCKDATEATIEISAKEEPTPKNCFVLPLLVAFFLSTTFGTLLTYNIGKMYRPLIDVGWMWSVILILAVFTAIATYIWYRITKKNDCFEPNLYDWFGVLGVVLFSAMFVLLYLVRICSGMWWLLIVLFFVIAALLMYLWIKKRTVPLKISVLYVVIGFAAAVVVCLLFGYRLLG